MGPQICGGCLQPMDRNGRCITNSCTHYYSPNTIGRSGADRGHKSEVSSSLDHEPYQRRKNQDANRFESVKSKKPNIRRDADRRAANKLIGKTRTSGVQHNRNEWTHPDIVEGTKLIKGLFGTFKIVKDTDSEIWKD